MWIAARTVVWRGHRQLGQGAAELGAEHLGIVTVTQDPRWVSPSATAPM